jgi:hypothetical protein
VGDRGRLNISAACRPRFPIVCAVYNLNLSDVAYLSQERFATLAAQVKSRGYKVIEAYDYEFAFRGGRINLISAFGNYIKRRTAIKFGLKFNGRGYRLHINLSPAT